MDNNENKKYDISKSNFFGPITESTTAPPPTQNVNTISGQLNLLQSNQSNTNTFQNNNITQSYPSNQNFYQNQMYQNYNLNQYYYPQIYPNQNQNNPQPQQSETFLQKIGSTANNVVGLIKKDDPINSLLIINKNEYDDTLKKASKIIECQSLEKNRLTNNKVKSTVTNPRKISDSILKQSYLIYDVCTPIFNWVVNRRYSDFVWLRECLQTMYPVEFILQLPKKKIGNRRFEDDFIEKRLKGLQNFIDCLLINETLKSAQPLLIFLSCVERGYFEQQMKVFSNNQSVIDIKSINGKLTVADLSTNLYEGSSMYFLNIENYFKAQNDIIKQVNKSLNNFNVNMVEACKNLEEVELGFEKLLMLGNKVKFSEDYIHVFEQYQTFIKNWKNIQIKISATVKNKLKDNFKYVKNNTLSLMELFDKEKEIRKEYETLKNNLNSKKEELWRKMDISKWELNPMEHIDSNMLFRDKFYAFSKMCFQETMNLNNKGELLGYYFYSNYNNFKNTWKNLEDYSVNSLTAFSKEIEPSVTEIINVWSSLANNA